MIIESLESTIMVMANAQVRLDGAIVNGNEWPGSLNVNEWANHFDSFQARCAKICLAEDSIVFVGQNEVGCGVTRVLHDMR